MRFRGGETRRPRPPTGRPGSGRAVAGEAGKGAAAAEDKSIISLQRGAHVTMHCRCGVSAVGEVGEAPTSAGAGGQQ